MRYFTLGKYNTWHDWGLTLTAKDLTPPAPKINQIDIPGAHGSLDLTEALTGEIPYADRTLSASFASSEGSYVERTRLFWEICTALHGKRIEIVEPDDPDHYFLGRVSIAGLEHNQAYMTFRISATCEPWRYAREETVREVYLANEALDVVLHNAGVRTVCPDITVDGSVTLIYGDASVTLSSGTYKVTDLRLRHGYTVARLVGRGTVAIRYREAVL